MYKLVIGNKNYSSWSLRPWLLMKVAGIDFEEIKINIYKPEGKQEILSYSETGKVPILINDEITIWDSLAIAEFLAEKHPGKALWPLASESRAIARAVTAEMHSSFTAVRNLLPMNCRRFKKLNAITPDLQTDIDRICSIWRDSREHYGKQGDFLFGKFSIVDAFFAPVIIRFHGYDIPVGTVEREYMDTMLALPELKEWIKEGKEEDTVVASYEV